MIRILSDAINGVIGIARLGAFRPGWAERFDVSAGGVARSFGAALLALPLIAFCFSGFHRMVAETGGVMPDAWLSSGLAAYALTWLMFPGLAAIVTVVMRRRDAFGPWIVLHNWTVLGLYLIQTLIYALYLAGLLSVAGAGLIFLMICEPLRIYIYCRVAFGVFGPPWMTAVGAAFIPFLGLWIARFLLSEAISPGDAALYS